MTTWNREQRNEQERVNEVIKELSQATSKLQEHLGGKRSDVVQIRKNFWSDVTVNLDDPDDAIETAASIKQQSELLSEIERSHISAESRLKTYEKLKYSPYFGRIDFTEKGESEAEKVYIGIASYYDEETSEFLVHDWRAPISSLYYDHSLGKARFRAPSGTIEGNLDLKRQFIIKNGQIQGMFDTGEAIGDELLQQVLGNQANTQMKSIVATIQKEQNAIIRNTDSDLLIVQGAAGCGKTSAALQRVAYLLYRDRETLQSHHIVLFSPNNMFNSYVANVLPELGEENMEQTTFQAYIDHHLAKEFSVETPFKQMEAILSGDGESSRVAGIKFKASVDFLEAIHRYVESLSESGMQFLDVKFRDKTMIRAKQISEYFYSLDSRETIPYRMKKTSQWILNELKRAEKKERKKPWVEKEIQFLDKSVYTKLYEQLQKRDKYSADSFNDLASEQKVLSAYVTRLAFKPLRDSVEACNFLDMKSLYAKLFQKNNKLVPEYDVWSEICNHTLFNLKQNHLANEDATPFLYVKELLVGFQTNAAVRHVFIDEAQDFSPFQFAFIQRIFPRANLTVLGDLNQSIYVHASDQSFRMLEKLLNKKHTEAITLTRSYRSTKEIVEFTKSLLKDDSGIIPFNRPGAKPSVLKVNTEEEIHEELESLIQSWQNQGHETLAVICRTAKESLEVYEKLKSKVDLRLMINEDAAFQKGIIIIPSYLAKGIEFDAAAIYDASGYQEERERKLFYTVCTRAMHELTVFYKGLPCPFIKEAPKTFYKIN
ncbi:RNA polymerase recycling motor HelD [Fictibacillus phosphorivorans]|uniref:RNA polymerase recycling motor HelD n=1 Tax=Fictibacillus phosphorivorans TaxID=1221500 RepID=UPI00203FF505|nr:RNA polymerase recycling motor HelD [Fictibacillus phosphorivorans]MCM3719032.1 AAA family ATPase [Fictibacillus phosphorivorans]MCM3776654.1 AAA family ATPase [Fictibacillus phosphorivorans]